MFVLSNNSRAFDTIPILMFTVWAVKQLWKLLWWFFLKGWRNSTYKVDWWYRLLHSYLESYSGGRVAEMSSWVWVLSFYTLDRDSGEATCCIWCQAATQSFGFSAVNALVPYVSSVIYLFAGVRLISSLDGDPLCNMQSAVKWTCRRYTSPIHIIFRKYRCI
jgi:hypothetical protein